jgi:hypothetical protein
MPDERQTDPDLPMPDADGEEEEGMALCISCMTPNDPMGKFCEKCGAPLQSLAAMGPFEGVWGEGFVYRQATEKPRSLVIVLGVWLIFGVCGAGSVAMLLLGWTKNVADRFIGAFLLFVSVMMIWRTTLSYLAWRRSGLKTQE